MRGYWEEVTIYAGRKTVRQVLLEETPGRANPEVRRKTVAKIIRGEKVLCKDYGSTAGDCQYDDPAGQKDDCPAGSDSNLCVRRGGDDIVCVQSNPGALGWLTGQTGEKLYLL